MIGETIFKDGRIFFSGKNLMCDNEDLAIQNVEKLVHEIDEGIGAEDIYQLNIRKIYQQLLSEASKCLQFHQIATFGSSVNGFRSRQSDVDFIIELKEDGVDDQLCILRSQLMNSKTFQLKKVIINSYVPLITVRHFDTQLYCDITFSSPTIPRRDVVHNTKLLKSYSSNFPVVAQSFRFLKHILYYTKFCSARTQGLSTYGHIILFIYFLTHEMEPRLPLIDTKTFKSKRSHLSVNLSPAKLVLSYLQYVSCELDSSKFNLDIRYENKITRSQNFGSQGKLTILDPYITKDLGRYMKEHQLYSFKLFCYHLLEHLLLDPPSNINDLDKWCSKYDSTSLKTPELSPNCAPVYLISRPKYHTKRKKTTPPKSPMSYTESWNVTIPFQVHNPTSVTPHEKDVRKICVNWKRVLGPAISLLMDMIDVSILELQGILVFGKETELQLVEEMFRSLPLPADFIVASCFSGNKPGAQLFLTTYHQTISRKIDTSAVKHVFIYKPSFQLPISFWRILRSSFASSKFRLYFLVPTAEGKCTEDIDMLARLYRSRDDTQTKYLCTLQLGDFRSELGERETKFASLPADLELHQILDMPSEI